MKRPIEWKHQTNDGAKRTVRVRFPGRGKIKWQFKRSDQPEWDYSTPPSVEDWRALEKKMEALYNRRRAGFDDLEQVRRMRREQTDSPS